MTKSKKAAGLQAPLKEISCLSGKLLTGMYVIAAVGILAYGSLLALMAIL